MKFPKKTLMIIFAATQLTACQWLHHVGISDQEKVYSATPSEAPLAVPATLPNSQIGKKTEVVPPITQGTVLKTIALPPGSLAGQIQTGQTSKTVLNQPLPKPAQ